MDQELADTAAYASGRCCRCSHLMAALFCIKQCDVTKDFTLEAKAKPRT